MAAIRIKGITVEIGGAGSEAEVPLDGNTTIQQKMQKAHFLLS